MFTVNGDMFGRYVKIPHVLANDGGKFIFKVVGRLQSNAYYNVPIGGINSKYEIRGAEMVDCLHVIQCGVDETEVLTVALKDCELVEPRNNAEKIKGMSVEELAKSRIDRIDIYCKSDTQMWTGDFSGIAENKKEALKLEKEWLESECDAKC